MSATQPSATAGGGDALSFFSNAVQAHERQLKSSAYGVATQVGLMTGISVSPWSIGTAAMAWKTGSAVAVIAVEAKSSKRAAAWSCGLQMASSQPAVATSAAAPNKARPLRAHQRGDARPPSWQCIVQAECFGDRSVPMLFGAPGPEHHETSANISSSPSYAFPSSALDRARSMLQRCVPPTPPHSRQIKYGMPPPTNPLDDPDYEPPPPALSGSFFAWLSPVIHVKEHEMIKNIGMDATVFLRFVRMLIWIFAATSIYGVVLIVLYVLYNKNPNNQVADADKQGLGMLTSMNVRGSFIWGTLAVSYLISKPAR